MKATHPMMEFSFMPSNPPEYIAAPPVNLKYQNGRTSAILIRRSKQKRRAFVLASAVEVTFLIISP